MGWIAVRFPLSAGSENAREIEPRVPGSISYLKRFLSMATSPYLTDAEFDSLVEVGTGFYHAEIPADHARQLLKLGLTYNLLGSLRITTAGRQILRTTDRGAKMGAQYKSRRH